MPRPARFTLVRRAALVLAVCATAAGWLEARPRSDKTPPRVYVFAAEPRGAATEEEQGRLDSAADLREALRRNRKIVLVTDASEAQVRVEVVGREEREVPGGGFGGTTLTKPIQTIVRMHVTFGQRDGELKGVGQATWSRAAKDAAERLVKWITR
ncbi:MAG: hypothetical protein ABJC89_09620 [Acidobacteriota bacterium]